MIKHVPGKERKVVGQLKAWSAKDEIAHLTFWLETFVKNIKNRQSKNPLIDANNYLAVNDAAWARYKDLSWAEVEEKLSRVFDDIETQGKALRLEELTDASVFTLEGKPLVKSLLYEVVDHPLHHFVKLYRKYGKTKQALEALVRLETVLSQPGTSTWTATSRSKIKKHRERLAS